MTDLYKKIAITVAVLLLLGGTVARSLPGYNPDAVPSEPTEAWSQGVPKLLIFEESSARGFYVGAALGSDVWREPFEKANGQMVYFDPMDEDRGKETVIIKEYPWFPKALKRVNKSLAPYFVFASQGKVSVGQIKNTEAGVEEFITKITSRLPK